MKFKGSQIEDQSYRYNSHNSLYGMYFYHIGDLYTKSDRSSEAVVLFWNSRNNEVKNSQFIDCGNAKYKLDGVTEKSQLFHAIYIGHHSSDNIIKDNWFRNITADPIRLRNDSNGNVIDSNKFANSGTLAYVSEWFCYGRDDCSAYGIEGQLKDGQRYGWNETRSINNKVTNNIFIIASAGECNKNNISSITGRICGGYNNRPIYETYHYTNDCTYDCGTSCADTCRSNSCKKDGSYLYPSITNKCTYNGTGYYPSSCESFKFK